MGKIQEAIDLAKSGSYAVSKGQQKRMTTGTSGVPVAAPVSTKPDWAARRVDVVEDELLEERIIAGLDYDDRVEPYRQLRAQVLKIMRDNGWHSLAITSAHKSAGKTVTAVNLAISISRDVNNQVLLVDLDLRTPSVDEKLNVNVEHGLVDYLNGNVHLDDVMLNPEYERLFVLPGKSTEKFSSELLASPQMKQLLNDLDDDRDESRIIILDLPPLLRNDDALVVTPVADATLFVVEDGVTTTEQLKQSLQMLKGANLIGTVLNKAQV
jgi:capsular exopolysaccharide synthesis family protein